MTIPPKSRKSEATESDTELRFIHFFRACRDILSISTHKQQLTHPYQLHCRPILSSKTTPKSGPLFISTSSTSPGMNTSNPPIACIGTVQCCTVRLFRTQTIPLPVPRDVCAMYVQASIAHKTFILSVRSKLSAWMPGKLKMILPWSCAACLYNTYSKRVNG